MDNGRHTHRTEIGNMMSIPETMQALNDATNPTNPKPLTDEAMQSANKWIVILRNKGDALAQCLEDRLLWLTREQAA